MREREEKKTKYVHILNHTYIEPFVSNVFSIPFYRAMELVKTKKSGVPAAFGKPKNTFGKKKMNLKRVAKVSRGALAAVQVHNTYVDAEEQRLKKRNKGKKLLVKEGSIESLKTV